MFSTESQYLYSQGSSSSSLVTQKAITLSDNTFSPVPPLWLLPCPSSDTPSWCCLIINTSGFCSNQCFYGAGSLALRPTPNVEDQGVTLCLVSTLRPFRHKLPNQDCKAPTDIALGVIETSKQLHQDKSNKVVTPLGAFSS